VGYGSDLMEILVTEGLAVVFAEKNWKSFRAPWSVYTVAEIDSFMALIKNRNKNLAYNHQDWFFGNEKKKWLGYKVGTHIIRNVLEKNKIDIEKLTVIPAEQIIEMSGLILD
jgi:uncharacterized protein YjaZ